MFTGLVQHVGTVGSADRSPAGLKLVVVRGGWTPVAEPARGDSVAVAGVCLTVEEASPETLSFSVIGQTLTVTKLGDLSPGDRVNLECAVTATQPMGGHFVQGHADGLGEVVSIDDDAADWRLRVAVSPTVRGWLVDRGSVSVDGVSLTLAEVHDDPAGFTVCLIPETLERTTLGDLAVGDRVHLEGDVLVKAVNARVDAGARRAGAEEGRGGDARDARGGGLRLVGTGPHTRTGKLDRDAIQSGSRRLTATRPVHAPRMTPSRSDSTRVAVELSDAVSHTPHRVATYPPVTSAHDHRQLPRHGSGRLPRSGGGARPTTSAAFRCRRSTCPGCTSPRSCTR